MNNVVDTNHIKNFISESGLLSESKIKKIENTMFERNIDFLEALMENNFLDQQTLAEISASIMGVPRVNLEEKIITLDVFKNIPELITQAHNLVCFEINEESISVAFSQTRDLEVLEKYIPDNLELKLFLADRKSIAKKVEKYVQLNSEENFFKMEKNVNKIVTTETFGVRSDEDLPRHFRNDIANDLYTEKFITGILEHAVEAQADFIFFNLSDSGDIEIAFRISDRNYPVMNIGRNVMFSISASIKSRVDINIFEKFIIKQGSCSQDILGETFTLFSTFTQTDFGETVTLQIEKNKKFKTDIILLSKKQRDIILSSQKKDSGFFILSGHKESGKSRTLYNFLEFDVAKHKDVYSLEHTVKHNLNYTKQISLDERTNIIPIVSKITANHADVVAVEKISAGLLPMLFNYVSTSKKVFLSHSKPIGALVDTILEMDFDKGQMVKNFALFIEHAKFARLQAQDSEQYFLNKEEIKTLKTFISEKEITEVFKEEGMEKESKKSLAKIIFHTRKKTGKKSKFFTSSSVKANTSAAQSIYLRGALDLGLFLENSFLKRFGKEKIKNTLRKEVKKAVLENALLATHRGEVDIKEVIKYLTK